MRFFVVLGALMAGASLSQGSLLFSCDSGLTTDGTCGTLNSTIADIYSTVFTNANASIYAEYGSTGLASSSQFLTNVTYTSYANALASHEGDANDGTAVASLGGNTTNPVVGGYGVALSGALASALGLAGTAHSLGVTSTGSSCTLGTAGCYNGIITFSNTAGIWYYRTGAQAAGAYDIFTAAEHEIDEILGTTSCIPGSNTAPTSISVGCTNGGNAVGAADLFRYASAGTRSFLSTDNGSTAYFSINGGTTIIAGYNNSPNGADYGDWDSGALRVQNAFGTPGVSGTNINNDGGSEIALLDAIGYNVITTPEPGSAALLLTGFGGLVLLRRRLQQKAR